MMHITSIHKTNYGLVYRAISSRQRDAFYLNTSLLFRKNDGSYILQEPSFFLNSYFVHNHHFSGGDGWRPYFLIFRKTVV